MPRCTKCDNWVSDDYVRVMSDGETLTGCLECEPNARRRSGVGHPRKSERGVPPRKTEARVEPDDAGENMRFTESDGPATDRRALDRDASEQSTIGRWA